MRAIGSGLRGRMRIARTAILSFAMLAPGLGCGLNATPELDQDSAAPFTASDELAASPALVFKGGGRGGVFHVERPGQAPESESEPTPEAPEMAQPQEPSPAPEQERGPSDGGNNSGGDRDSSAPAAPLPSPDPTFPFVSIDARLDVLRADLDGFDNPSDRERIRYIDFTNLANSGLSDRAIEPYRQAVSLLVNSLSKGDAVVVPFAVDDQRLLYRLDLRDYAWNAGTWEAIISDYPYAVSYDEDSRILPYDERTAQSLREDTRTFVPYIQADWFLANASSARRYYDALEIPGNLLAFARDLGVDVGSDIEDAQVVRAGFNSSSVALSNRVIERHELPGSTGSLWLTYDFVNSVNGRNVFSHPLDFEPDQSEGLFSLPNGLQGYFIGDSGFRRLDKAATSIVTDPQSRDRAVQAGVSCMGGCHLQKGIELASDEVRDYVVLSAPDGRTIDQTLGLYGTRAQMAALMAGDQARYKAALAETGFEQTDVNAFNELVQRHQGGLDIAAVAAVLGVKAVTLARALDSSPQVFPSEILPLRDPGAEIARETLDAVAGDIVEGLGLGVQIRP